jgi:GNAT superfamily N-acetyltransferase
LWVEGRLRGQGYGTMPVTTLEEEARAKGCQLAVVDTFSSQAPAFYAKLGHEIFGSLEGYPHGYQKFFPREVL